jgi:outer membrane lipoprotein LolB
LALRIEAGENLAQSQPQSFFAAFELRGSAQMGELVLLSPLGTILATLTWTPQSANLRNGGEARAFENLDAMLKSAAGTEFPVASLFAWLAGDNQPAPGWLADLSQLDNGKLTATRSSPQPAAELRIVLEP